MIWKKLVCLLASAAASVLLPESMWCRYFSLISCVVFVCSTGVAFSKCFIVQLWHFIPQCGASICFKSHKPDLLVGLALFTTALYIKLHFVDRY